MKAEGCPPLNEDSPKATNCRTPTGGCMWRTISKREPICARLATACR